MAYLNPFNLRTYRKKGFSLSSVCPWVCCVDDGILLGKNGAISRSFSFVAPDLGSSSAEKIASVAFLFNNSLKRLGEGWAVQFEVQRNYSNEYPRGSVSNGAAFLIERQREQNFKRLGEHFESNYYVTFTYQLPADIKSKAKNFFFKKSETYDGLNRRALDGYIHDFRLATDKSMSVLNTRMAFKALNSKELVTYLHTAVSLDWHPVNIPDDYMIFLDRLLCDTDLDTSFPLKLGNAYIPIISINGFPSETTPAILDGLNAALVPYRWSTRFINYDKENAKNIIRKYQKRFYSARKSLGQVVMESAMQFESTREDAGAYAQEGDANAALVEVTMGAYGYGEYTSTVMVWENDYETAVNRAKYLASVIGNAGFNSKEETFNAAQAFFSMMPGNMYANLRRMVVSTGNVSHIVPLSSVWSGMKENAFLNDICGGSSPHVVCSTDYGIPFFLNLNVGDVGHTWISGPTGAGKSTLLALLEIQWLKYKGAQVIILDKDKSARAITVCSGGLYIEPGKDGVVFQPLAELETPQQRTWACEFIECLLLEQKIEVTALMRKAIFQTINLLSGMPKKSRTLSSFIQYCNYINSATRVNDVNEGVSPYTITGLYGALFDSDSTNLPPANDWIMYEMGSLMNMAKGAVAPSLMFIFKEIEKRFDGRPTLLVMDEAWLYFQNPVMVKKITEWLKTLRKKHVFCVFATQEIEDAAQSSVVSTIISQCASKIYLADISAKTSVIKEAYKKFGLEDSEITLLSESQMKKDYFYKSAIGTRKFRLDLDDVQLGILTASHASLDAVEKTHGKNTGKVLVREVLEAQGIKV